MTINFDTSKLPDEYNPMPGDTFRYGAGNIVVETIDADLISYRHHGVLLGCSRCSFVCILASLGAMPFGRLLLPANVILDDGKNKLEQVMSTIESILHRESFRQHEQTYDYIKNIEFKLLHALKLLAT